MQSLLKLVILSAILGCAFCATSKKVNWTKLHVTWSFGGLLSYLAKSAYFDIPSTVADAQKAKWQQARAEEYVTLWCMENDPRVCALYDKQGNIAGMHLSYPQADLANAPYEWKKHSLFTDDTIFGQAVASGRFYLVPQETLKAGGRARVDELGSGLWLQNGDSVTYVPSNATELEALGWTNEACIPSMGRHYYYNITPEMDCQSFEPYFLLVDNGKNWLHGLGFQTFGVKSKLSRDWFENVPSIAIKPTIPNTPQCLIDWADKYGVLSLHVYFVDSPYTTMCLS